ncbi:MAG: P-II family nitrogen regulator [Gammaproteobacteria bacterium]|nr:P-II family nitrogen regulator [Gammaproteobacteria bacterium]
MDYRKVTAIIQPSKLEAVEIRLKQISVPGVSVTKVKGYGQVPNFFESDWTSAQARIEIFIAANKVDEVVQAIMEVAYTGIKGDGIIAVLPVESLYHIRSGQLFDAD